MSFLLFQNVTPLPVDALDSTPDQNVVQQPVVETQSETPVSEESPPIGEITESPVVEEQPPVVEEALPPTIEESPSSEVTVNPVAPPNEVQAVVSDFTYEVLPDNTIKITGYTGTDTNLVLPDEIDGLPVTVIGAKAFQKYHLQSLSKL